LKAPINLFYISFMSQDDVGLYEELSEEEIKRRETIKRLSIKTLSDFLMAEIIGFGFGVPLAVILAILYGNIADIFMEIYFMPTAVVTVVVTLFVAYPTNLYLTRQLIKTIFNPTIENAQKFSLVVGKVSFYAFINLVIRISIGGFVADIWGVIRQQGFVLDKFVTLGIAPVVGAFVAGVVFYFVSQNILSKFNIEVAKLSQVQESKLKISYGKLLPISDVFSSMITGMIFLVSLIISIGYFFKVSLLSVLIIVGVGAIMVGVLVYFYVSCTKQVITNLKELIRLFGKKEGKVHLSLVYDIEESAFVLKEYLDNLNLRHATLMSLAEKLLDKPTKIDVSNMRIQTKLRSLIHLVRRYKISNVDTTGMRKIVLPILNNLKEISNKLIEIESNISFLSQQLKNLRTESESVIQQLSGVEQKILFTKDTLSHSVELIGEIKESANVLREIALSVIPKTRDFLKIANEIEITFINFQLEMSKINYPLEFKTISDQLNKNLRRIEEVTFSINEQVSEISKLNESIVSSLNEMVVSIDYASSFFENIIAYARQIQSSEFAQSSKSVQSYFEKLTSQAQDVKLKLSSSYKILYESLQLIEHLPSSINSFNKGVSALINDLENSSSTIEENGKMLQELESKLSVFKKG